MSAASVIRSSVFGLLSGFGIQASGFRTTDANRPAMLKSLIAFCLSRRAIVMFGLLAFAGAGFFAYKQLNIEAYPNPTPVILEITAQAPGLSAEEMERYYTRPIEIGLYTTPGIDVIRSTSFYGLSFVRVMFKYGVEFHFAYGQAAVALQQNVSLPGGQTPTIQQNSTTGEIYRYQVVGPKHFGLTNLRTVQDWVVRRRLLTIPGIVQVNSWGGPTKEFEVEVDPHKLETYNITVPQVLTALGNANLNVGGREIRIGQQSINIRGVGLIDDGGSDDLTQGYKVDDIENVVLTQANSVPVLVKDVARVSVGYVPRLGILGRDQEDDVVGSIVVMSRTEHAHDMIPKVKAELDQMNHDGTLPSGVRLVPYYDRSSLVAVTTHTVLHNLIFGCLLVFLIQWIFLGDLRSAIIVGINIPFALFFAIILLVLQGESANLLSVGAVDFGIIVDSAVILVENIFRNFQRQPEERQGLLRRLADGFFGPDPTTRPHSATQPRMDRPPADDPDQRDAGGQGHFFLGAHHRGRFRAAVHDAGDRGPNLRPDGANLRLRPGRGLGRHLHDHARARVLLSSRAREGSRDDGRPLPAPFLQSRVAFCAGQPRPHRRARRCLSRCRCVPWSAAWQRIPPAPRRGQFLDSLPRCR